MTPFLAISDIKDDLGINDDKHDSAMYSIITSANSEVEKQIVPFAADTPLKEGSIEWERGKQTATYYARMLWFERINQFEKMEMNMTIYKAQLESLKSTFMANRTTRTITTVTAKNIRSYPLSPANAKGAYLNY